MCVYVFEGRLLLVLSVKPLQHSATRVTDQGAGFTQSPNTNSVHSHQIPTSVCDSFTASCQRSESGALDTTRLSAYPVFAALIPPRRAHNPNRPSRSLIAANFSTESFLLASLESPRHLAYQDVFVYSFARANIIALIPLVREGARCRGAGNGQMGKGLGGVFWSLFRKRKVDRPSVQTLYENSSYLTKIRLPKRVYFGSPFHCNVYSAGRGEGLGRADTRPVL